MEDPHTSASVMRLNVCSGRYQNKFAKKRMGRGGGGSLEKKIEDAFKESSRKSRLRDRIWSNPTPEAFAKPRRGETLQLFSGIRTTIKEDFFPFVSAEAAREPEWPVVTMSYQKEKSPMNAAFIGNEY